MIAITGTPLTEQRPLPPMPTVSGLNELQGFTRFYIGVNVSESELRDWSPQRITTFFEGIAKVIKARGIPHATN